ncbi:hypothetical protein GOODEAATRI_013784, partial [Goodea atripinnis]
EFDVLSQIRLLQASCSQYNLPNHPKIAAWLHGHKLLTDQESYEMSRQLEPPVDTCSPTSWKSPSPCGSSSDCTTELCSTDLGSAGTSRRNPHLASHHKRSISMTALPMYNHQGSDSCIIRVSVDLGHNNGNMYKSILVIQRALEKHYLEHLNPQDFTLSQIISQQKELLVPDKANVFYAMSTTANFDFVLRKYRKCQKKPLRPTTSLGLFTK